MAVTIKDVAREAGTSVSTVSKVMNNAYDISKPTADKVNAIIKRLNYHPNVRAQNFAKKSSKSILFLTELHTGSAFENPHLFDIITGAEKGLREKGFSMILKSTDKNNACAVLQNDFAEQTVDGVIIHASLVTRELDKLIQNLKLPHIVIGMPDSGSFMSWIDTNNVLGGEIAANHMISKKHRNIAFIGGEAQDKTSEHRLEGVQKALSGATLSIDNIYIKRGNSTYESGFELTKELTSAQDVPDAIICANNYIAFGCVMALQEKNIKIPQQVAVITFDDFPFSKVVTPKLSVVKIDVFGIGMQAAKTVISKIKKPDLSVQMYTTLPSLIERESTR